MPSEFQTYRASIDDVALLAPLFDAYRVFYGCPSDLKRARTFLVDRLRVHEAVIFFCSRLSSGSLVGFTLLYPSFSSISAGPIWILNDLYVSSDARRSGVGRGLIEAAHEFARKSRALRVVLSTAHENQAAQSLYESIGYVQDTEFRNYSYTIVSD